MSLQKIDTYKSLVFRPCEFHFLLLAKNGDEIIPIKPVKSKTEVDTLIRELRDDYGLTDVTVWEFNKWNKTSTVRHKTESISLTEVREKRKGKRLDIKVSSSRPQITQVESKQELSQTDLAKIAAKRKPLPAAVADSTPATPLKSILKPSSAPPDVPAYISEVYNEDSDSDDEH